MLIKKGESLVIITTGSATIHYSCNYSPVDSFGNLIKPNNKTAEIASATTTTLFTASQDTKVTELSIRNAHASLNNNVTVAKIASATTFDLSPKFLILSGEMAHYSDRWARYNSEGALKFVGETGAEGPAGSGSSWGGIDGDITEQIDLQAAFSSKVSVDGAKVLSDNNYSNTDKAKVDDLSGVNTGDQDLSPYATNASLTSGLADKVDKVTGKGLSTEDYTTAEKTKVGYITISQAVDLDDLETRVNDLDAAVVLKGTWAASGGTFPASAQAGWSYLVTADGTIDGVEFKNGDRLICVLDNASTSTYASNWYKADYTDRVNSVAGRTGNVVITSTDLSDFNSAVTALIAAQAQPLNSNLTTIAAISTGTGGVIVTEGAGWLFKTFAQLKTLLSLTKSDVGLGSVVNADTTTTANITDSTNKRFITDAQQTVLGNTSGTNSGNETTATTGALINAATDKSVPVDADYVGIMDSAASNILKKLSWSNLKATLKTYFDTVYKVPLYAVSTGGTITGQSLADLAGMSITLTSGTWIFEIYINAISSSTAGNQWGINYTGSVTSIDAVHIGQTNTTTWAATARITANNTASTVTHTTGSAEGFVRISGQIVVSTSGNLTARGLKVLSGTLTYRAASYIKAYKIS